MWTIELLFLLMMAGHFVSICIAYPSKSLSHESFMRLALFNIASILFFGIMFLARVMRDITIYNY